MNKQQQIKKCFNLIRFSIRFVNFISLQFGIEKKQLCNNHAFSALF